MKMISELKHEWSVDVNQAVVFQTREKCGAQKWNKSLESQSTEEEMQKVQLERK